MKTFSYFWQYLAEYVLDLEMFQTRVAEEIKPYSLCSATFSRNSCHLWANVETWCSQRGRKWIYGGALHALRLHARKYTPASVLPRPHVPTNARMHVHSHASLTLLIVTLYARCLSRVWNSQGGLLLNLLWFLAWAVHSEVFVRTPGHGSSLSDPPKFIFHWSSSHRHHVVGDNWLHRKIHHKICILLSDDMDGNSLSCSVRCSWMWKLVQWRWRLWFPSKLSFSYTKLHGVTC
jgi:hypothetical protein